MDSESGKKHDISYVMPAYNEVESVAEAVSQARTALEKHAADFEIIVVDDGSSDGTGEALEQLRAAEPALRVIQHPGNLGYGAALRNGFAAARHGLVFYTDSDLQFDADEIKFLLPLIDRFDIVAGFRIYRFDPVIRCMLAWGYNRLVRIMFGIRVRDVDCAFKLMKKNIFEAVTLESNDFFIDAELLCKARARGFTICEIGVKHFPRRQGRATVRASNIPRTLRELIHIWFSIHFPKRKTGGEGGP